MKYEFSQEVLGELSNYDNHPADTGTELLKEKRQCSAATCGIRIRRNK